MIIMCIVSFAGETFLPEYPDYLDTYLVSKNMPASTKYGDADKTLVCNGRYKSLDGKVKEYEDKFLQVGPSRHFTYIFNIFVMM